VPELTQDWIFKTLASLGFKETDAKVYFLLSRNGYQKAADIAKALKMHKRKVYRSLRNLREKGSVTAYGKYPAQFSATPLENVLATRREASEEEANIIEKNRVEILAKWQALIGNLDGEYV
jgi:sugar-specific transcriptional regulator TrmB